MSWQVETKMSCNNTGTGMWLPKMSCNNTGTGMWLPNKTILHPTYPLVKQTKALFAVFIDVVKWETKRRI